MTYNIQYHSIDGEDGGTIKEGFESVEAARQWAADNLNLSEYEDDVVQIHEEDTDDHYGVAVEDLN
jgi:hypothetical protein